ncbi:MAG: hypothetical protein AAGD07_19280 [Planctomycetota bacterium]
MLEHANKLNDVHSIGLALSYGWFLLGAILPAIYFLGLPWLIKLSFAQNADPKLRPVDPSAKLPEEVREYFYQCHEQFAAIGFEHVGTFDLPDFMSNVRCLLVGFVNQSTQEAAVSAALYSKVNGDWVLQQKFTEFDTSFADGSCVNTGNQSFPGAFPVPDEKQAFILPHLKEVAKLHQAHAALVKTNAGNRRAVLELDTEFHGDAAVWLKQGLEKESQYAFLCGYLNLTERTLPNEPSNTSNPYQTPRVAQVQNHYRPTIKGAHLMTWRELFPIKQIRTSLRLKRDRNALAETGVRL